MNGSLLSLGFDEVAALANGSRHGAPPLASGVLSWGVPGLGFPLALPRTLHRLGRRRLLRLAPRRTQPWRLQVCNRPHFWLDSLAQQPPRRFRQPWFRRPAKHMRGRVRHAVLYACMQAEWLRLLLATMGFPQDGPTVIYEDNEAAISMAHKLTSTLTRLSTARNVPPAAAECGGSAVGG
jgi:hypothetical protein